MPILKDFRQTKVITLPSYPDSKVEIYDSLLVGQLANFDVNNKNMVALTIDALPQFIKSWNFTNSDGKDLPITRENLNFLQDVDAKFLIETIAAFAKELKKKI